MVSGCMAVKMPNPFTTLVGGLVNFCDVVLVLVVSMSVYSLLTRYKMALRFPSS